MSLPARVEAALGAAVTGARTLHGGDLSEVTALDLADGRSVISKAAPRVETEARMLRALALTGIPVPEVLHAEPGLLLLQRLEETSPTPDGWARLGSILRAMHGHEAPAPGWPESYAFGTVEIPNDPASDWPSFWAERRLLAAPGALPADLARRLEALCARLTELIPKHPAYGLLHGDLWTGNLLFGTGTVHLIDPACSHGDPEVDLAMLHLFGTPGEGFHAAYGALESGWEERRNVYSLWPAIVHLRLFGATYRGLVEHHLGALGH